MKSKEVKHLFVQFNFLSYCWLHYKAIRKREQSENRLWVRKRLCNAMRITILVAVVIVGLTIGVIVR